MKWLAVVCAVAGVAHADTPSVPAPEITKPASAVKVPAIPTLDYVKPAGGAHGVQELHVDGKKLVDTKVTVRGYVVWIYDCVTAVRTGKESTADAQKRIDDDPTLCERPRFYLGDTASTKAETGLWIVDVPRPANKVELKNLPKDELARRPPVPKLAVGDYVAVTGDFKLRSPHGDANSDGLVVYEKLDHVAAGTPTRSTLAAEPEIKAPKLPSARRPAAVSEDDRKESVRRANAGSSAIAGGQLDTAVAEFKKATTTWPDNALAWYGMGAAYAQRGDWKEAQAAFERAVEITPDSAMYEMWAGIAFYERAAGGAREDEAKRLGRKPEEVAPDLSVVDMRVAEERLLQSVALEPRMWRAHYYLGKIARDHGRAMTAAKQFSAAVTEQTASVAPYIALGELYRRWEHPDEAIAVMQLAIPRQSGQDLASASYVLGMAYDDKGDTKLAIDAYSKALDANARYAKALFQRGQVYFRTGDKAKAKADLEAFVKLGGDDFARSQANKMLLELGSR